MMGTKASKRCRLSSDNSTTLHVDNLPEPELASQSKTLGPINATRARASCATSRSDDGLKLNLNRCQAALLLWSLQASTGQFGSTGILAYADKNDASNCLYHRISWHQEVETRLKSYEAREPHGLTYIRRDEGSEFTGVGKALENASPPGGPRATIWPKRPQVQQAFPSCYYALFRFSHYAHKSRQNHNCSNKLEY